MYKESKSLLPNIKKPKDLVLYEIEGESEMHH